MGSFCGRYVSGRQLDFFAERGARSGGSIED